MGLFSKKTYTCKRCGATYESRMGIFASDYCKKCSEEMNKLDEQVQGIINYTRDFLGKELTEQEKRNLLQNQTDIFEKYRPADGNSNLADRLIGVFKNGCKTKGFIALSGKYRGVVVENTEIVAVAYDINNLFEGNQNAVNVLALTSNPYFPAIPVINSATLRSLTGDTKRYLAAMEEEYSRDCPNLAYPLMKASELKKMLKKGSIAGCPATYETLKDRFNDIIGNSGTFNDFKDTDSAVALMVQLQKSGYSITK